MKRSPLTPLLVAAGLCVVALASSATAQATSPTPAPTPAPTVASSAAPTSTTIQQTTTTEVPYYKTVRNDCSDYTGDEALADELDAAKGSTGSGHLVTLARYCGVLFSDEAKDDPDLKRPASNLEYAVGSGDDPFFSTQNDVVTANQEQTDIVIKASSERWLELHPELATTTVPATTESGATTTTPVSSTTPGATTVPSTGSVTTTTRVEGTASSNDQSGGGNGVEMFGYLAIGVAVAAWAVYGVRRPHDAEQLA